MSRTGQRRVWVPRCAHKEARHARCPICLQDHVIKLAQRLRYSEDAIQELQRDLPDEIDLERESKLLTKHNLTRDSMTSMMGGSP